MDKYQIAQRARSIYSSKDNWTYVQGGLGEIGESKRIKSLYEYYWQKRTTNPNTMTRPYSEWVTDHAKQQCTDCSNLINVLLGYDKNYYSVWSLSQLPNFQGELKDAPIGTVLWLPGHIGFVVEPNTAIDFYKYEETCRISKIDEGLWQKAVFLPEIDYEEKTMKIYDWSHTIQRILFLYTHRDNITYCLGCSGEVAGRDVIVENQFKYYYDNGWKESIGASIPSWTASMDKNEAWNEWLKYYQGKMCFDCSGLIDWCIGYEGIHKYSSWEFGQMKKNESLAAGVAGSVLWKKGHVGLDIGYGYEIEIGGYGGTLNLYNINERGFTSSHLITEVDYTGADAR